MRAIACQRSVPIPFSSTSENKCRKTERQIEQADVDMFWLISSLQTHWIHTGHYFLTKMEIAKKSGQHQICHEFKKTYDTFKNMYKVEFKVYNKMLWTKQTIETEQCCTLCSDEYFSIVDHASITLPLKIDRSNLHIIINFITLI